MSSSAKPRWMKRPAVYMVMCPFINPVQLQYNLDTAPTAAVLLASLILRSLSLISDY